MPKFDKSLRPQDDFYHYVNNDWFKNNPIPPSESAWGTFYELRDESAEAINKIIDEITKMPDAKLSHDQKLIKNYFLVANNYDSFADGHMETLKNELKKIQNISDKNELSSYLGYAHRSGLRSFWADYVSTDDKNSQLEILRIHQDGIRLPNRDYYIEDNKRMRRVRAEYEKFFGEVSKLIVDAQKYDWKAIFDIELTLARASWTDSELRDIEKSYNRFTIRELGERFKGIDWPEYLYGLGWKNPTDNIVIDQPSFVDAAINIINTRRLDQVKDYLSWNLINDLMPWVNEKVNDYYFDFYGKVINGKKEKYPLWKRVILQADSLVISQALGREYAHRYFPESSKKAVLELVNDIRIAYHKRMDQVTWMEESTKKLSHKKLDNMKVFIGYPSKWRDLSQLHFSDNNHLENILTANVFMSDIEIAKVGNKPAYEEWHMNAHTVNAYNDPNQLAVYFPAAILQPPFFDPSADYATNLGGIGSVIGHELTHGFDDQGGEFDEHGNMKKWQTEDDLIRFKKLSKNIIQQADRFEVLPGVFLNGNLILGEVIADIGGLELAVEALRNKTSNGDIKKEIQKLFINAAVFERSVRREESIIIQAKTDPHPPGIFRVNCVVSHINAFYEAFDVTESDKLYLPPEKRAHIW